MDHRKLNSAAKLASGRRAKEMGLELGDEVTNGLHTYRIIAMSGYGVSGRLIAEQGHFVFSSSDYSLDLRPPGWTRILPPPPTASTCG